MEEQNERLNPVNEKELLAHADNAEHHRRLSGQGHCGGSATPSMGLSMYRGGKRKPMLKGNAPDEAHQMGAHLGAHLHQLHGSGFFDSFKRGFESIGSKIKNEFVNPNSVLRHDIAPKVANEFTDPNSVLRGQIIPEGAKYAQMAQPFLDAGVPGLGTAVNTGFKAANYANKGAKMVGLGSESQRAKVMLGENKAGRSRNNGPALLSGNVNGNVSGSGLFDFASANYRKKHGGAMTPEQLKAKVSEMAKHPIKRLSRSKMTLTGSGVGAGMLEEPMPMPGTNLNLSGGSDTGAYEGQGRGRSARASIVKRVMAEKGMKMIEASKYVKAHNLY